MGAAQSTKAQRSNDITVNPLDALGGPPVAFTRQGSESPKDIRAFTSALERAYETRNPICWTLARVRVEFLRSVPSDYIALIGDKLGAWAIGSERAPTSDAPRYEAEHFTNLFKAWELTSKGRNNPDLTGQLLQIGRAHV